jgi:hypothetical protein
VAGVSVEIRVRSYNVEFGDCVLFSVNEGSAQKPAWKHALFDFGNVAGKGGPNELFAPIAADIKKVTHNTLDLLVMTHEHLDHMEGFYHQRKIFDSMKVKHVWMSIPSAPDYYQTHPKSRKALAAAQRMLRTCHAEFRARGWLRGASGPMLKALIQNNLTNTDRVNYVRKLGKKNVHYLYRGVSTMGKHPFQKVDFRILAPEEEMSVYYGKALAFARGMGGLRQRFAGVPERRALPRHISRTEFERLRDALQSGELDAVQEIDAAKNNTSLVVLATVGGKKLLFTGDAEVESWEKMQKKKLLGPVDFLKVSHHGSWNGTPKFDGKSVVETLFPATSSKKGAALVSTKSNVYGTVNKVPHEETLQLFRKRCEKVYVTEDLKPGKLCYTIKL